MANSADPVQLASKRIDLNLHCLQRQGMSGFSRTRVKQTLFCHDYHMMDMMVSISIGTSCI